MIKTQEVFIYNSCALHNATAFVLHLCLLMSVSLNSSSVADINFHLTDTYGALYIGLLLSAVLFGIVNLQVFVYFQSYKADRIWSKIAVCWLWLLDAFHLALISHVVYFYLVTNYANPLELTLVVWSFYLQFIIEMFAIVTVQSLYAVRLWKLTQMEYNRRSKIVPSIVVVLLVAATGVCIALSKVIYTVKYFYQMDSIKWAILSAFVTACTVDIFIAMSLCFTLAKLRTGFEKTDSVLNSLMLYILSTGVLTSICSIISLVLYAIYPHKFVFLLLDFPMTQLYVNAFLAMFNGRHRLQTAMDKTMKSTSLAIFSSAPIGVDIYDSDGMTTNTGSNNGKINKKELPVFSHSMTETDVGIVVEGNSEEQSGPSPRHIRISGNAV